MQSELHWLGIGRYCSFLSLRVANGDESLVERRQSQNWLPVPTRNVVVTLYPRREEKSPEHTRQREVEVEKTISIYIYCIYKPTNTATYTHTQSLGASERKKRPSIFYNKITENPPSCTCKWIYLRRNITKQNCEYLFNFIHQTVRFLAPLEKCCNSIVKSVRD